MRLLFAFLLAKMNVNTSSDDITYIQNGTLLRVKGIVWITTSEQQTLLGIVLGKVGHATTGVMDNFGEINRMTEMDPRH